MIASRIMYYVVCDNCQNEGPVGLTEREALWEALEIGWTSREATTGKLHECRHCLERILYERNFRK